MGSVRHRVIRQLVTELFGITFGLVVTVAAMIYLDWYLWPALVLAVLVAATMSVVSCMRARVILRSPLLTVMELRRRGGSR
jgi:hypothetical protein